MKHESGQDQRANILNAARTVFARKGSSATMAEIAIEAGVSQGLAYRYFPSKGAILTTLVKEAAESGGGPSERMKDISGSPGQKLELLVSSLVKHRFDRPGFYQFVYQVLRDDSMPNELREIMKKNGEVVQGIIRELIIEGQATGEIRTGRPGPADVRAHGVHQRSGPMDPSDRPRDSTTTLPRPQYHLEDAQARYIRRRDR